MDSVIGHGSKWGPTFCMRTVEVPTNAVLSPGYEPPHVCKSSEFGPSIWREIGSGHQRGPRITQQGGYQSDGRTPNRRGRPSGGPREIAPTFERAIGQTIKSPLLWSEDWGVDGGSGVRGSHQRSFSGVEIGKIWGADLRSIGTKLGGKREWKVKHRRPSVDFHRKIREGGGEPCDSHRRYDKPPELNELRAIVNPLYAFVRI
jgi:hypothetical protein